MTREGVAREITEEKGLHLLGTQTGVLHGHTAGARTERGGAPASGPEWSQSNADYRYALHRHPQGIKKLLRPCFPIIDKPLSLKCRSLK